MRVVEGQSIFSIIRCLEKDVVTDVSKKYIASIPRVEDSDVILTVIDKARYSTLTSTNACLPTDNRNIISRQFNSS